MHEPQEIEDPVTQAGPTPLTDSDRLEPTNRPPDNQSLTAGKTEDDALERHIKEGGMASVSGGPGAVGSSPDKVDGCRNNVDGGLLDAVGTTLQKTDT